MGNIIVKKSEHIFKIVAGVIFFLGGMLLFGFIISLPAPEPIEQILNKPESKKLIESGIPERVINSFERGNFERFNVENDTAIIVFDAEWTIRFKKQKTLGGKWRGENPELKILRDKTNLDGTDNCFTQDIYKASSKNSKWMSISTHNYSDVRPYMKVRLSAPDSLCMHQFIKARATMKLVFPSLYSSGYENKTKSLKRDLFFFLISEDELLSLREIIPEYRIVPNSRLVFIGISLVFVLIGVIAIISSINDKRKRVIL